MMSPPLEISCRETQQLLAGDSGAVLVDCRERHEHELVHLPGNRLLPMSELASRVEELSGHEQDAVVVYCHHGGRSAQVAMWLRSQGFERAQSMAGGIDRWAVEIEPGMVRY